MAIGASPSNGKLRSGTPRHSCTGLLCLHGRCLRAWTDLDPRRQKLWKLVEQTPNLDWLLLTKRPGHIKNVYPWAYAPRDNVWLGTTAENQRWADRRRR